MSESNRWERLRKGIMSWSLTLVMVLVVSFVFGALRAPELPEQAPNFTARSLTGEQLTLADLKGQPVILNFWATWCGPCRFEVPAISRFSKRHPEIAVWGITAEPSPRVKEAVEDLDIDYAVLLGDPELLATYSVTTFPTTIFIDAEGNIRSAHVGALWDPQLALAAWGL
ncbi:MAG: TlpA family protein disulfide reductase [Myxococcota bacterium]